MKTLVALSALTLAFASPALAQQRTCGNRAAIVERLDSKYGEQPAGMGLSNSNSMVEVFASEETGTWTILITMPSGQTCLVAAGEYWDAAPDLVKNTGQPT